eukprot:998572-Rhodomonas_salina.1
MGCFGYCFSCRCARHVTGRLLGHVAGHVAQPAGEDTGAHDCTYAQFAWLNNGWQRIPCCTQGRVVRCGTLLAGRFLAGPGSRYAAQYRRSRRSVPEIA